MPGPNPLLVVRQNLAPHVAELEERRVKLIAELLEVNHSLALAYTLQQVLPVEPMTVSDVLPLRSSS